MRDDVQNTVLTEANFRREIKSSPKNGYLFFGEEDYLKKADLALTKKTLCPDPTFDAFNYVAFDALTYSADALADALSMPSMMQDKKLVTVQGVDFLGSGNDAKVLLEDLCAVLDGRADDASSVLIVVIPASGEDVKQIERRTAYKTLSSKLYPVAFEKSSDVALNVWIKKHFEKNGVTATDALCRYLLNKCGHDMYLLSGEIEKLSAYVAASGRKSVENADVDFVSVNALEFDTFAFANAIASSKKETALRILAEYKGKRVQPTYLLGQITDTFYNMLTIGRLQTAGLTGQGIATTIGMNAYRVGLYQQNLSKIPYERIVRALQLCDEADRRLKRSAQDYAPIEQLICSF